MGRMRCVLRRTNWNRTAVYPSMKTALLSLLLLWMVAGILLSAAGQRRVLVYTRNYTTNGKGYVHENIQSSVDAIKKMGLKNGLPAAVSTLPATFSEAN